MSAPATVLPKKRVHPVDEVLPIPKLATYGFQADANPIAAARFGRLDELS